jgi:hypothetical protein
VDQVSASVDTWLDVAKPTVVLLFVGTNNMTQGDPYYSAAAGNLSTLLDRITSKVPEAVILVASITPLNDPDYNERVVTYNSRVSSIVSTMSSQGKKVQFVDIYSALTKNDLSDGIHPGASGYSKMANVWYNALIPVLNGSPPPSPTPTPTPTPTGGVYLSDLAWSFASNGWGPVELDHSNGEEKAGDGRTLTINGTTYQKGLGVHASSEIRYSLGGQYTTFTTDVGVDDEMTGGGSVVFQVWADGVKLYDSGLMRHTDAARLISVSVAGRSELRLVVTNGGDGETRDHANWAAARLISPP